MAIVESGSTLPIAFNTVGTSRCVTAAISTGTTSLRPPAPGVRGEDLSPRKRHRKTNTTTSTSTLTICTMRARVLPRRRGLICGVSATSGSADDARPTGRSEEHTSELQSRFDLVCRLLLEKKKIKINTSIYDSHIFDF